MYGDGHHNTSRSIGEKRLETQLLEERLKKLSAGETVKYKELSEIAGTDVQLQPGYGWLRTARKTAEEHFLDTQEGGLLSTVPKVGVQRLPVDAQAAELDKSRLLLNRRAHRCYKKTRFVNWHEQSDENKAKINGLRSLFFFASKATTTSQCQKLTEAARENGNVLSFQKTLQHFSSKKTRDGT